MRYLFGQTQQTQKVEQSSPMSGVMDCETGSYCLVRQFAFEIIKKSWKWTVVTVTQGCRCT